MQIKNILTKYSTKLSTTSTPKLDVEVLLSFAIKKPKEFLYTCPEYELNKKQLNKFNRLINRRIKNEPIAYITGEKEFYGLKFIVNKNVLIPRPETELMVEETINEIKKTRKHENTKTTSLLRRSLSAEDCGAMAQQSPLKNYNKTENTKTILIDIGTGTGCIPISVLKNIKQKIQTYAIDNSQTALNIAKKNAKLHNLDKKIKFLKNDLLQHCGSLVFSVKAKLPQCYQTPLPRRGRGRVSTLRRSLSAEDCGAMALQPTLESNIIITANLPYISNQKYKQLSPDIKNYEPKNALIAGPDGLKYYSQLFKQIQKLNKFPSLNEVGRGLNITLIIEIDIQSMCPKTKILKKIKQYLPSSKIEIKKDLSGAKRVMIIKKKLNSQ